MKPSIPKSSANVGSSGMMRPKPTRSTKTMRKRASRVGLRMAGSS